MQVGYMTGWTLYAIIDFAVSSCVTIVQVQSLLPSAPAAKYYSLRGLHHIAIGVIIIIMMFAFVYMLMRQG